MSILIEVWPEFAHTLRVAARKLRGYEQKQDWTDLDVVADRIDLQIPRTGAGNGTLYYIRRDGGSK